jgi:hypothetical protein
MSDVPHSDEPKSLGDFAPPADTPEPAPATLRAKAAVTGISTLHTLGYALGAALVAGFLAWGIGEKTYGYYQIPASVLGQRDFSALNREERIADQKNTAIAYGTFGALLGLLSGVAGGAVGRSIPGGASAALAGLVLGGIGGSLASYALAPIFDRLYSDESASLVLSSLVRGGIWAVVGITSGLALGWGWHDLRGIPRALLGGLAGGVCGTIAFEVANAVLFPADRNDAIIPSSMVARMLAYLFVSVGVAIGAVLFSPHRSWPESRTP